MGSLDHSLNTTKKLANERDRGEKPLLVFVITRAIKKRRRGDADLLPHLQIYIWISKRLVGIDLGVKRRAG